MKAYSEAVFGSTAVRQPKTKSWAATGLPSSQRAPARRWKTALRSPSSHRSATPGTISPPGAYRVSPSMTCPSTKIETESVARVESSCGGSAVIARRITLAPGAEGGGSPLEQAPAARSAARAAVGSGSLMIDGGEPTPDRLRRAHLSQEARADLRHEPERLGHGRPEVREARARAERPAAEPGAAGQERDVLARVVGGGRGRIAAVVRRDGPEVAGAQAREERRQALVQ